MYSHNGGRLSTPRGSVQGCRLTFGPNESRLSAKRGGPSSRDEIACSLKEREDRGAVTCVVPNDRTIERKSVFKLRQLGKLLVPEKRPKGTTPAKVYYEPTWPQVAEEAEQEEETDGAISEGLQ
jgi:hypothetical protein